MSFYASPEYKAIEAEAEAFRRDTLAEAKEEIYGKALPIFIMEEAWYVLSERGCACYGDADMGEIADAVKLCRAGGHGFLASFVNWVFDTGSFFFQDTNATFGSLSNFAEEVNSGEWEL